MSRDRPWSKFWWEDYENDASLKLCSLAAQGLWMRMLCFMHQSADVGHLALNGRGISVGDLAELVGKPEKEVTKLVDELEARRVFSRDSNGRIYNRRMVKDEKARKKSEADGRRGGNPTLKPNGGGGHNGGDNPPDKGGVNPPDNGGLKLQEAEAEAESESKKGSELRSVADGDAKPPPDVRLELWAEGLTILRGVTGKSDRQSRAMLGKLLKTAKDDCAAVLGALRRAADLRPVDPISWITKAVEPRISTGNAFLEIIAEDAFSEPLPLEILGISHVH